MAVISDAVVITSQPFSAKFSVIGDDVVLAGQPFRQNVCLRAVAIRETIVPAIKWRLCIKPNSGAA